MDDELILIDFWTFEMDKAKYIGMYVYSKKSRALCKVFSEFTEKKYTYLDDNIYYNINQYISPVISPDGKLKLRFVYN